MEKGIKAWIANQDSDAVVELPSGWHWNVSADGTGYLMTPENQKCVGYDINTETIRFGADGEMNAPGLNLWTVQEMGEKFARESFMDDSACEAYDTFSKERRAQRSDYEKGVRAEMAGLIQVELKGGEWTAHVDTEAVKAVTGIESEPEISREEGIALFNRMSEARNVMPLRDPMGYMTLDGNTYDYIKDQYEFQYDDTIQNIDAGFINGNGRGCEAVLDKLDSVVRKNVREYCLPEGMNYQDLRHVDATPEIQTAVNDFVKQRVTKTVNFEKKRSHSAESLAKDHDKFVASADNLKLAISEEAQKPLDVSLSDGNEMKI